MGSSLPYHHVGLPRDEVKKMDKFFQEQRDKRDLEKLKEKKQKESYAKIKEEFKARIAEDAKEGKIAGLDQIFGQTPALATPDIAAPPPKEPVLKLTSAKPKTEPAEKITLSADEMNEIDALLQGTGSSSTIATYKPAAPTSASKEKKEKLE